MENQAKPKSPSNPSAFPELDSYDERNNDMELIKVYHSSGGMSLRDYFAAKAMQSFIQNQGIRRMTVVNKIKFFFGLNTWRAEFDYNMNNISKVSFDMADEMLKKREL